MQVEEQISITKQDEMNEFGAREVSPETLSLPKPTE